MGSILLKDAKKLFSKFRDIKRAINGAIPRFKTRVIEFNKYL
jgi:hypothetical protein